MVATTARMARLAGDPTGPFAAGKRLQVSTAFQCQRNWLAVLGNEFDASASRGQSGHVSRSASLNRSCFGGNIRSWPCPPSDAHHDERAPIQLATFQTRCAEFVRTIDIAIQRAEASYAPEIWQSMRPSDRSAAVYRELRALDAESLKDGSALLPQFQHRVGRRRTPRFRSP
jgi:hypothetical protein